MRRLLPVLAQNSENLKLKFRIIFDKIENIVIVYQYSLLCEKLTSC